MTRNLITFLTGNNFSIEQESAYSFINGYQVSIRQTPNLAVQIFSFLEEEQIQSVTSYLKENNKVLHISSFDVTPLGVCINIASLNTLMEALEKITNFLSLQNAKNQQYCPVTGEEFIEETKQKVQYNQFVVFINEASVEILNAQIEAAEQDFQNAPNNYLKGALGAIIGGALGAIVWVVIGAFTGFMSGWIAFLIAFLAGLGYDKMKGKPTNMKFVVAAVVTLCYAILSMIVVYILLVKTAMNQYNLEGNPISVLFELMELDDRVKTAFIIDMVLALLFGVFGVFFSYFQMKKTLHKKQEKIK
ncbi:MAG: hypothetical protein K2O22_00465 [Anaeroplasmataceae bacterium]|nr:hypothetical protein [Anaeroplasmataceae bacterium]